MLNINYELLKLFQVVTQEPTLKDTAKTMGVTPSAISQSLKKLELEMGFQLFLRERKKLTLSPKGKELKVKLMPLLHQLEHQLSDIITDALEKEPHGLLTIGAPFEMGSTFVVRAFAQFLKRYPKVQARLKYASPLNLLEFVRSGEVDFALSADGVHFSDLSDYFSRKKIFEEELVVIAPANWTKSKKYEDLIQLPHLDYAANGSAIGMWYQFHFKKSPKKLNIPMVAENALSLVEGVKAGLGIAMVPYERVEKIILSEKLNVIAPSERKFRSSIVVLQHQNKIPSLAEKKFLEFLTSKISF